MKKSKNNLLRGSSLVSIVLLLILSSCKENINKPIDPFLNIESQINDSLDIKIYYGDNGSIRTIILNNSVKGESKLFSFHKDGITPTVIGSDNNGLKTGPYYTFYSDGTLNCRINYQNGEYEGNYICYSEEGEVIYKAFYENGIEKTIEINDTINDQIIMY